MKNIIGTLIFTFSAAVAHASTASLSPGESITIGDTTVTCNAVGGGHVVTNRYCECTQETFPWLIQVVVYADGQKDLVKLRQFPGDFNCTQAMQSDRRCR